MGLPMKGKYAAHWKNYVYVSAAVFRGILALATVTFILSTNCSSNQSQHQARVLLVIWSVVPPIWFWFEFFFMWKTEEPHEGIESFKYGHEVSRNIWLAFVALLVALYLAKDC